MERKPLQVLLVEDNPGDARLYQEFLHESGLVQFELEHVKRLKTGLEHLAQAKPDAILLDLGLPDSQGLETFNKVYAQAPQVPIVILTGLDDAAQAVEAVQAGAQDYLIKGDVNGAILVRSLRYAIERKRAMEALGESEGRYRELVQDANCAIIRWKSDGTLSFFNEYAQTFFGYTAEEAVGRNLSMIIPGTESSGRDLSTLVQDIVDHPERFVNHINENICRDGHRVWMAWTNKPIRDENGRVSEILGVGIDFTERKLAEASLRDSEVRYRGLFEDSPIALWEEDFSAVKLFIDDLRKQGVTDFHAYYKTHPEQITKCVEQIKVVDVNKATLKLFEAKNKTDILTNLSLILGGRPQKEFEEELVNIAKGKTNFEWQGINYTMTREPRVVNLHWSVAPGHEDVLDKVLLSMIDITEQKQAEEQIKILSKIPGESPNPIVRVTPQGILLYSNPSSALLLAMWKTQVGQGLPVEWQEKVKNVFNSGIYQEFEVQCGEKVYSLILAPIVDAGYINIYGRDITQRKKAEEALVRRTEELNRLYRATGSLLSSAPYNLQGLATTIVDVVVKEFGQANCSLIVVQKDSNELVRLATSGPYTDQVNDKKLTLDGLGLVPQVISTGMLINANDIHSIPGFLPSWEAAQSELTIPLKEGDNVIGVIDIQSSEPDTFNTDDERWMSIFAERAALALERGRLNEELERRVVQLTSLRTVDMAISGSTDINITMGILLDQVIHTLGVHAADVLIFNPLLQSFRFLTGRGFRTQALQHTDLRLGDGYAGQAALARQVVIIRDLLQDAGGLQRSADFHRESFVSYIGAPLIVKGQVRGVLEIFQRSPLDLNPEQRAFLEILAGQAAIAIDSSQLFENLQSSNSELMMAYDETIEGWSRAMDLRDKETEGHTQRVTELTMQLANNMGIKGGELVHFRRGALLHDIGKIGVPDDILHKPGALTDEEWVIMRRHPQLAYDMLTPIIYLRPAVDIPWCHHEKWDGTGYPRGLKGEEIPLAARIFALVDVWDALCSDRPYRKAWPEDKVRSYIQEQAGKHFDPHIAEIFLKVVSHIE